MKHIGLTGGIATGKSTVAKMFVECGTALIDADQIVHELYESDHAMLDEIRVLFGTTERASIREVIFTNDEKRQRLEQIIHPRVRARAQEIQSQLLTKNTACLVHDIPLLFESGNTDPFDAIVVAHCDVETQISRLCARDHCRREDALQIIAAQLPLADKIAQADYTIDTDQDLATTRETVRAIYQQII